MSRLTRRTMLGLAVAAASYPVLARAQQPADGPAPQNAEALLVVYPDYPVNTDSFYGNAENVGHAGVMLISATGLTKYYEFGRYPPNYPGVFTNRPAARGNTRNVSIANVILGANGKATPASLGQILSSLSREAGKNGRIRAAHFINMNFAVMETAARAEQPDYEFLFFNCGGYAERVAVSGHPDVDQPLIINPTPRNIVDEYIEEGNAEVLWNPGDTVATIGEGDEADAKE